MILKQMDARPATVDPRLAAGRKAEEQMAHYLERAFGNSDEIFVINDLRFEPAPEAEESAGDSTRSDAAQIDHLVFHRWGFVIIESKSITGRVRVNRQGEWSRVTGYKEKGETRGMPSPVLQAQRQARFLHLVLEDNAPKLLSKLLGVMQYRFGAVAFDTLVAISDQAVIDREKGADLLQVYKADQIPGAVREILLRQRRATSIFNIKDAGVALAPADLDRVREFLLANHRNARHCKPSHSSSRCIPVSDSKVPSEPVAVPAPKASAALATDPARCRHCNAESLAILYGRYGYYFKCGACDGNTAISISCPVCEKKVRLRKDGLRFYLECAACNSCALFFTNPVVLNQVVQGEHTTKD